MEKDPKYEMSSYQHINWSRVVRYVSGEYAPEEEADMRAWIAEDSARAALANELRQVWDATERSPSERDVGAAWETVSKQLERNATETEQPAPRRAERRPTRYRRRTAASWGGIAAGAVLIAVAAYLVAALQGDSFSVGFAQEAKVFETQKGQRATVHLNDGTRVLLNVDSKLTLQPSFEEDAREVLLSGEAYFDVAPDAGRPFIVQTEQASVHVLGTSFTVEAYDEDRKVQVAVAEGEVALKADRSEKQDTVILRPRHLGIASGQHLQAVRHGVDLTNYLAWTKGKLIFRDAQFKEVRRKLGRWYDLRVDIQVPLGAVDRLNATFDVGTPRESILKAVAAALDLDYTYDRSRGTVTFYRRARGDTSSSEA